MGQVTKSGQNNITSPAGNSLAVFVDGASGVLKLKDIRGNIEPMSNYTGDGAIPNLQEVLNAGNTATVPDVAHAKGIILTLGGIGTINNPDGIVINNNGRGEVVGGGNFLGSFDSYLKNKDNISFFSRMEGEGGTSFLVFVSEDSDLSGLAYQVQDSEGNNLFSVDELGNLIAKKIAITGGTPNQYLMADGSTTDVLSTYSNIVYVNSDDPNSATIFDLNNPPVINDDALKDNSDNLYIGLDASTWVYNTEFLEYETKEISSGASNYYFEGTHIDSGASKNSNIERTGNLKIIGNITANPATLPNQVPNKSQLDLKQDWALAINPIAGITYTIAINDYKNRNIFTNTNPIAFTVPTNGTVPCLTGTSYEYTVQGTGTVTVGGAGITFIGKNLVFTTGDTFTLTKDATDTWSVSSVGDVTTNTNQRISGFKEFLAGTLGLRNIADTITSYFSNYNTASRTYNLQDRNGTLLDDTDLASINANLATKQSLFAGVANYITKSLNSTTLIISRLFDNGTYFGIGTVYEPTKDLTFGNQANREIGIEESNNTIIGRDLTIRAGRTINYVYNVNFNPLLQIPRNYRDIATAPNGNVYACVNGGDIYMQTSGAGNFVSLAQNVRNWSSITAAPNGNIYACTYYNGVTDGDIYMQIAGEGNFVSLGQTLRTWYGLTAAPNGNVYACVNGGDIYMQTAGTGNFIPLAQTLRIWRGLAAAPNGNIYAVGGGGSGDIYMQTAGVGNFVSLGQTLRSYEGIAAAPNGNIYACVSEAYTSVNGDIYMQIAGEGNFVSLGQTLRNWYGLAAAPNGNVYACVDGGDIYMQNNDTTGKPNLDGGTLKSVSGTGKGTGKSRYEIWTGQKLASGTDMQVETLREYIDENGYHIYTSMPVYGDNASALIGGLPVGCEYRTDTGVKMIVF